MSRTDTIAARATPPGKGGVGIIRVSGKKAMEIAFQMTGQTPIPRQCEFHSFRDDDGSVIDMGIVLYFAAPKSFTGEDVIEFHGHGGVVVMDILLSRIIQLGARMARPGEFSERAFLNGKLDLAQAEAIADLIESSSIQAARSAVRSLQGNFSKKINQILNQLIELRMFVEAAIDFPDEEVDFLADEKINEALSSLVIRLDQIQLEAKQGALLREGMKIVIAGKPNAGKSSLLNCLSGNETAIVTDIPGTTRDLLHEHILVDGIPLHIVDTAGLRKTEDKIELEGIRRARNEMESADRILLIVDGSEIATIDAGIVDEYFNNEAIQKNITIVRNKIDKTGEDARIDTNTGFCVLTLSAKTGDGIDLLREHLKECVGANGKMMEDGCIARSRHLDQLAKACLSVKKGIEQFQQFCAGELLAEDLRQAQLHMSEITGAFTPDDLLGKIFSSFCIGK